MLIDVLIPARNPTEVFTATVDSLLAQTDRGFRVVVSDNYSTTGTERIEEAVRRLREGGIEVRVIRPPWDMGRVQHWNWLHHQSEADWLKPLFVGDWLEPDCLASCRTVVEADPTLGFVFWYYRFHRGEETFVCDCAQLSGRLDPVPLYRKAIFHGHFVGAPLNVFYRRSAFQALGGHHTSLPLTADFDLYARMAMQVPTYVIPRVLGHFVLHENRFAKKGSGTRRESMNAELALVAAMVGYAAFQAGHPLPARELVPRMTRLVWEWTKEWGLRSAGRVKRRLFS